MVDFSKNIDEYGMIVQDNGDGGDSAQRVGMYLIAEHLLKLDDMKSIFKEFPYIRLRHSLVPGLYRRHPNEDKWYGQWDRFSRDQATPLVIVLGLLCCATAERRLREFFIAHLKRFFFMTNTKGNGEIYMPKKIPDFAGNPEFLALYIRAFKAWWLYPVLLILDLETLIGSIIWRFTSDTKSTDILNHALVLVFGANRYWTPINWLARMLLSAKMVQRKFDIYFGNGGPPMNELYKPIIKEYFR